MAYDLPKYRKGQHWAREDPESDEVYLLRPDLVRDDNDIFVRLIGCGHRRYVVTMNGPEGRTREVYANRKRGTRKRSLQSAKEIGLRVANDLSWKSRVKSYPTELAYCPRCKTTKTMLPYSFQGDKRAFLYCPDCKMYHYREYCHADNDKVAG